MATATLLPPPRAVFSDACGNPLAGGFVYTYVPGGTTPKTTWQDAAETTPNTNPIPLDGNGSCLLYGSGSYQITVTDKHGNAVPAYSGLTVDTLSALTASTGAGLIGYAAPYAGSVTRTVSSKLGDFVSALDFGADPTGAADSTAALNAAFASTDAIYIPAGNYTISGSGVTIARTTAMVAGAGPNSTIITFSGTSGSAVTMTGGNASLSGVRITRTGGTPTSTAIGFDASASLNNPSISDVILDGHYNGAVLGSAAFAYAEKLIAQYNYNNGIVLTNTGTGNTNQWDLRDCLAQQNDVFGFYAVSNGSASQMILGQWRNCTSFANGQYGAVILGTAGCPIQDGRFFDCFFGSDGLGGFVLNSFGRSHQFANTFFELAGQTATGRTLQFAASLQGNGLLIDANENPVLIDGCWADSNSFSGFAALGAAVSMTGCFATNNRQAAGTQAAIALGTSTIANIVGGYIGAGSQTVGISGPNGFAVTLTGVDIATAQPVSFTTNSGLVTAVGCNGFVSNPGTQTNNNALTGQVGEYVSASVASGAAVALTTGAPANVTSIILTAGDWDVSGLVCFEGGTGTVGTNLQGWISTSSATIPTIPNGGAYAVLVGASYTFTGNGPQLATGTMRLSLAATTTVYLSCFATFTASTCAAYGFIGARRAR